MPIITPMILLPLNIITIKGTSTKLANINKVVILLIKDAGTLSTLYSWTILLQISIVPISGYFTGTSRFPCLPPNYNLIYI